MRLFAIIFFCIFSLGIQSTNRPNIVLILIDDLGLTDLQSYGGEISTPNINALAKEGMLFSNYHTTPECAPSRAMLLTGMDNHNTGIPMIPEVMPWKYRDTPGYEGYLREDALTLAEILKPAGYKTYMTGKWHLAFGGEETAALPYNRGFDKTFILDATGGNNYSNHSYLPYYVESPWFKNGEKTDLPKDFYSSKFFVDQMIKFIEEDKEEDAPFFSYLSFQAQHIPLQAPKKFIDKYIKTYEAGWEVLREQRKIRAVENGIFPSDKDIVDSLSRFESWSEIEQQDKKMLIKSMAVFAGMLDAMDFHLGRFVNYLKEEGLYENTIFIVTADNGPEGNDPTEHKAWRDWFKTTIYDRDYETLGDQDSYVFIGTEFAQATASPSHLFKFHMSEGGLRVPLIISGPDISIGKNHNFAFVTDVAATISDIVFNEIDQRIIGKSLKNSLAGSNTENYMETESIGLEVTGNSALFKGNFKIVRNRPPNGSNAWNLYNLSNDPGETSDLAQLMPEKLDELIKDYDAYVKKNGVIKLPQDYQWAKEMTANTFKRLYLPVLYKIIAFIGLTIAIIVFVRRRIKKSKNEI
ncbi:MAG: arylsulfatase [Gammaproteobacteria bacterium]|nr:arylsulfatase [Gammaproteobacteria bacterium]